MKILDTRKVSFVLIDTDEGEFRVWHHGAIDIWDTIECDWDYFDKLLYDAEDVRNLQLIASEMLRDKPVAASQSTSWNDTDQVDRQGGSFTIDEILDRR